MNDIDLTIDIFTVIDDIIKSIEIDPKPGPKGRLSESEILTLMILQPVLKPFCDLKRFHRWIKNNFKSFFQIFLNIQVLQDYLRKTTNI